jgi:DNA gyrase subunit B
LHKVLSSTEIVNMITVMGTGIGEEFNIKKLRYHRIVIMTDADVDGAHIRTLLLTFFYRHMLPLIEQGHIFIAKPPLYRLKKGNAEHWIHSDAELEQLQKTLGKDNASLQRYKGLGEMNPKQLWATTMDPSNRELVQVAMQDAVEANEIFTILMGDEVEPRRQFIMEHAAEVRNLDI